MDNKITLNSIHSVRNSKPPRILIYGPPGIGKTTLASEFPDPIFLQIEDGTPGGIELKSFGHLDSYDHVMDAIAALYSNEHDYRTIVIDSITELQHLVYKETCKRGDDKGVAKNNIEDFGYGKGYVYAQAVWVDFLAGLTALRAQGMSIVLIAHSAIERFDDPETVSYDRYQLDLHKKSIGSVEREMDAILLLKQPITIETESAGFGRDRAHATDSGHTTLIHAVPRPAWTAKNRYGMPSSMRYDLGHGYSALAGYLYQYDDNQSTTNTTTNGDTKNG